MNRRGTMLLRGLTFVVGFCAALLIGGFFVFVDNIPKSRTAPKTHADAIVVLTGGAARIEDGLALLREGYADRLLISGVHPNTSKRVLANKLPHFAALFACCVDIDHQALNTFGNATETSRWAAQRGIRSLIVVTSSYHLPRSMIELERAIPDVVMSSYAVMPENVHVDSWWLHPGTLRLLSAEYVKYLAAHGRRIIAGINGD